jgi:hypothetical protein
MRHYLLLACLLVQFGCSEDFFNKDVYVELPPHEPRIVLNTVIVEGDTSVHFIITQSIPINGKGSTSARVAGVKLSVKRNGIDVSGIYLDQESGHFISEHQPQVGDVYKITIDAPGFKTATSETIIPPKAVLLSAKFAGKRYDLDGYEYAAIKFRIKDVDINPDFFEVVISRISSTTFTEHRKDGTDSVYSNSNEYDDSYLSSPYSSLISSAQGLQFSDAIFKNNEIELEIWADSYLLDNANQPAYEYEYEQEDGTVVNVKETPSRVFLKVNAVTNAYHKYMSTYDIHQYNQYPDLFSGEPVPMPNNIENGFGLFAAKTKSKMEISLD